MGSRAELSQAELSRAKPWQHYFRSVGVKDGIQMPHAGRKRDFDSIFETSGTSSTPEALLKKRQSLLSLSYEDVGSNR
jgi:hypothetical protein